MTRRIIPHGPATTLQSNVFYEGEIAYDETNDVLRVGDGVTAGGNKLARADQVPVLQTSGAYNGYVYTTNPIFVGTGTVINSVNPAVTVCRPISSATESPHCFSDSSQLSFGGGLSYNSFDVRTDITAGSMDHHAAFQVGLTWKSAGTLTNVFGLAHNPGITNGTITHNYAVYVFNPVPTGLGVVGRTVGLFMDNVPENYGTAGNPNYVVYSGGGARSFFGGQITTNKLFISSTEGVGSKNLHVSSASDVESIIRIQQQGYNTFDLGIAASSIDAVFRMNNTDRLVLENAGHLKPAADNTQDLGTSALSWRQVHADTGYYVGGTKVIGAQGAAVADATDASSVITQLNALLSRLRAHGLIAT